MAEGLSGEVGLEFDVDEDGRVANVVVKTSAGHGFDEAATAAAKQFIFEPGTHEGAPVSVHISYSYRFTLKEVPKPVVDRKVVQVGRLEGFTLLRGTREPIAGAHVIAVDESGVSHDVAVDARGHFLLAVPAGKAHVVVSGGRAKRFSTDEQIRAGESLKVNYFIEPTQYGRYESTVRGQINREEISRKTFSTEELMKMPGSFGDALRAIENFPGVARAPFNSGLIIVRGGKPTDSRVFMGGAEVPQLYHFAGLTSVVPTALIDHIDFMPGNFSVRYGRAIAGAIDLELREPKRDRWHGELETNVFDTGFMVEGPVGQGSLAFGARRSYIDALIGLLPASALKFATAPVYYDYQAVFDYPLWGGKIRVSVLGSDDELKLVITKPNDIDPSFTDFGTHIYYHKAQIRYTKRFGNWQFLAQNASGVTSQSGALGTALNYNVFSVNSDFRVEARYQKSPKWKLLIGLDTQYAHVDLGALLPSPPREGEVPTPLSLATKQRVDEILDVGNIGAYAELTWKPNERITVTPGLRFDYFSALQHTAFNPRMTAQFRVSPITWIKAGLGLYSQDPQPPDYDPHYGNPNVRPESAIHSSLGVEQGILPGLSLEVTGFYKYLYDLVAPSTQSVLRNDATVPENVASTGIGRIYGGEFSLRQAISKRFFGMLSYTVMRSERKDCSACAWRLFDYDQTHVFVAVLHAYLPRGWEAGFRFRYVTGFPYTAAAGGFYDADSDVFSPAHGPVNTARLDSYQSLDLRVDKTFLFKRWLLKLYLDVSNVYNHANPEITQFSYDYTKNQAVTGLPIIPSFGIRGEF